MKKILKDVKLLNTAAIHDLSGFGRCSLTVVIPVLSAMGIQVIPMPTALLSTHTGGFNDFSFLDLTEQMEQFTDHWAKLDLTFNSIYSGFLGSEDQVDTVIRFIDRFKRDDTIVLIDPVMGDNGTLYATITDGIHNKMKLLARHADILTPNITEAFFLLDMPVPANAYDETDVNDMLYRLSELGPDKVVITGIQIDNEYIGTASYNKSRGSPVLYNRKSIHKHYPGTGDIFASVLLGNMMKGMELTNAARIASDFVYDVISDTLQYGLPERNGVLLENNLYRLIDGVK